MLIVRVPFCLHIIQIILMIKAWKQKTRGDCMMDSMIKKIGITFKELEENMFRSIMEQGQKAMR